MGVYIYWEQLKFAENFTFGKDLYRLKVSNHSHRRLNSQISQAFFFSQNFISWCQMYIHFCILNENLVCIFAQFFFFFKIWDSVCAQAGEGADGEGEAGSLPSPQHGAPYQDLRIMSWTEGRRLTSCVIQGPLRHVLSLFPDLSNKSHTPTF